MSAGLYFFGVMGMILVIIGIIKSVGIFSHEFVFGLFSLLFALILQDSCEIKQLKEIIENGN